MKKYLKLVPVLAALVCLILLVPRTAHAAGVAINATNFPDSIFRKYVKDNFDTDKNSSLSAAEITAATDVDVYDMGVTSLKGIEYLTELEWLSCMSNKLTSLNVKSNTKLVGLYCGFNAITSLDLSKNTALKYLSCNDNKLTQLNVTNNTLLEDLSCGANQLTSLNLAKNKKLIDLNVGSNKLTSLDVSNCPNLNALFIEGNQLTAIDLSKQSKLTVLSANGNSISKLDISASSTLVNLYKTGEKNSYGGMVSIEDVAEDYSHYYLLNYDETTKIITSGSGSTTPTNPFVDVKKSDSFYSAVMWAVENGITKGTDATHFSPNANCTRYQFAVMLYKLNGQPAASGTLPFKDVKKTDSYYNAVLWAYTNGIISGTSKTTFSPKAGITRYQVVQMLYKTVGKPAVSGTLPFKDVSTKASYYNAVRWAVQKGITKGTDSTHFSPKAVCKRYQLVVFLYKFNNIYHIK